MQGRGSVPQVDRVSQIVPMRSAEAARGRVHVTAGGATPRARCWPTPIWRGWSTPPISGYELADRGGLGGDHLHHRTRPRASFRGRCVNAAAHRASLDGSGPRHHAVAGLRSSGRHTPRASGLPETRRRWSSEVASARAMSAPDQFTTDASSHPGRRTSALPECGRLLRAVRSIPRPPGSRRATGETDR